VATVLLTLVWFLLCVLIKQQMLSCARGCSEHAVDPQLALATSVHDLSFKPAVRKKSIQIFFAMSENQSIHNEKVEITCCQVMHA